MNGKIPVAHVFLTLNIGGMEKVGIDLIENMDSDRYENHVICLKEVGALGESLQKRYPNVVSMSKQDGLSFGIIKDLANYFRECGIKIVHTNNSAPHFWAGLAAVLAGIKVRVHTNHGRNFDWPTRRIWLDRFSASLSRKIICVSEDSAAKLSISDKINPRKLAVIPNGIDTSIFSPGDKNGGILNDYDVSESQILIGSVARFSTDKDQETLIRAFHQLLEQGIDNARLLLVGDGDTRQPLEQLANELQLGEKVIFAGFRTDIVEVLRTLDIYVLPSHTEGLSISLLEAMSTEKAIVASAVGGNTEIIQDQENGLLVADSDVEGMAVALKTLIENPEKGMAFATKARNTVLESYSIKAMVQKYQDLYESVLSQ
ncbi:MAG: glycosyltransferase [Pseudomonadales bacterium]|nr:glycosyltransferase [Pseudomonadales bacterium]